MSEVTKLVERLGNAVTLESGDAAIRIRASYEPQAGQGTKVFPASYIPNRAGERYHFEKRWDEDGEAAEVVLLDSVQSEASRAEGALARVRDKIGLPVIATEVSIPDPDSGTERHVTITSLDAPHRSRDAYFLDSTLDGDKFDKSVIGKALLGGSETNATPYLQHAPADLIYGVWDSHRGKRMPTKFARAYSSEIVGWHPLKGKKGATKTDPLALKGQSQVPLAEWRPDLETNNKKKDAKEKLSELGHGMIPVAAEEATGGVSVRSITRLGVVSLTSFARYGFGDNAELERAGRVALAALALLGDRLAFANAGLHLRSGSDLVMTSETLEWVGARGATESFELTVDEAFVLLEESKTGLTAAGLSWDPEPVLLEPAPHLQQAIEQTYLEHTLAEEE